MSCSVCMYTTNQSEQGGTFFPARSFSISSPASLRSFLPPDLVNCPLQSALHRSLAEALNIIIRRCDVLIACTGLDLETKKRERLIISVENLQINSNQETD